MRDFSKFHFKNLEDGDAVLYVLHRNWFYLFTQFLIVFSMLVLFFGTILVLPAVFPGIMEGEYRSVVLFFENTFFLAIWIFGFLIWIDYWFDIWIITSQRIVNVEQKGMFMRRVSELRYEKIQDVTTVVNGVIPTMLNYGDLQIQTAGEQGEFLFRTISDPYRIKNIIMELQKKAEKKSTDEIGRMIKEKINPQG